MISLTDVKNILHITKTYAQHMGSPTHVYHYNCFESHPSFTTSILTKASYCPSIIIIIHHITVINIFTYFIYIYYYHLLFISLSRSDYDLSMW